MEPVIAVTGGAEAFGFGANPYGGFLFEQVEREVPNQSKVFGRTVFANSTVVFAEGNVQHGLIPTSVTRHHKL